MSYQIPAAAFALIAEMDGHGFVLSVEHDLLMAQQRCEAYFDWFGRVEETPFRQWLKKADYLHYYPLPETAGAVDGCFTATNGLCTISVLPLKTESACVKTLGKERQQSELHFVQPSGLVTTELFSIQRPQWPFSAN